MHNINGIAVQHAESKFNSMVRLPTQSMKRTRQRSLQAPDVNLVSFWGAKKSSLATLAPTLTLEMHHHIVPLQQAIQNDSAYYLTKIPNIPSTVMDWIQSASNRRNNTNNNNNNNRAFLRRTVYGYPFKGADFVFFNDTV